MPTSPTSLDQYYHYLLAIDVRFPDGAGGTANATAIRPPHQPICTFDDIQTLQRNLAVKYPRARVTITNLVELSGPTDRHQHLPADQREDGDGW